LAKLCWHWRPTVQPPNQYWQTSLPEVHLTPFVNVSQLKIAGLDVTQPVPPFCIVLQKHTVRRDGQVHWAFQLISIPINWHSRGGSSSQLGLGRLFESAVVVERSVQRKLSSGSVQWIVFKRDEICNDVQRVWRQYTVGLLCPGTLFLQAQYCN
jgi:hypothetical protein